jgi:hypothetical protein
MTDALVLDDTAAARQELAASQYGAYPNAEELIRGQFAATSPELRTANRLPENLEERAALKEEGGPDIDVPEGGRLLNWTVRGLDPSRTVIVYVWADEAGNVQRGMQGHGDYKAPPESAQDKAVREIAMHDAHARDEAIKANLEIDQKVAEMKAELSEEMAERFAALGEELTSTLEGLQKDAEKEEKAAAKPAASSAKKGSKSGES